MANTDSMDTSQNLLAKPTQEDGTESKKDSEPRGMIASRTLLINAIF
jgi:hypothetical protein